MNTRSAKPRDAAAEARQAREFIKTLGPFDEVRVDNHSVPISHLTAFTDSGRANGRVWTYDRKTPSAPKHLAPPIIAKQKGLYLIEYEDMPDEIPEDFIERVLATYVEAPFPCIRNKLVYGLDVGILPVTTDRERLDLAMFMAVQQMRTPAHRRRIEWLGAVHATFDLRVRLEAALGGGTGSPGLEDASPRELRKYIAALDRGDLRLVPPKEHWLWSFLKVAYHMAPMVAALPWRLVRAPEGVEFVTCDAPVVSVTRAPGQLEYSLGGGWANPTSETVFAVSPKHVLVVGRNAEDDPLIGTAKWCVAVRDRTIRNADRFVFARSADTQVGEVLASSEAPTSVVDFAGEQYPTSASVGTVVKRLMHTGDGTVIRWGPPR